MNPEPVSERAAKLFLELSDLDRDSLIAEIKAIRESLHGYSPFKSEPVDFVRWIRSDGVVANDYNPNSVAPPEMKLLELSIQSDGYTQPIVTWNRGEEVEVVDGFHRHRVGKESKSVKKRLGGYLPVVVIQSDREDRSDRIAATIRHNRARGKHSVEGMSDIVLELKRRNWSGEKIGRELGMDPDEVLRLTQIAGLAEMFADKEFSQAWEPGTADAEELAMVEVPDAIE
jgi:ParB-like chromosome segregation protein Spo0J